IGEQAVRWRVADLTVAALHKSVGETDSTSQSDFMLGWLNAGAQPSTAFDQLRRSSSKGTEIATAWGQQLTQFWQQEAPLSYHQRIATALPARPSLSATLGTGTDPANPSARLTVSGISLAGRLQLFSGESGYDRSLPSAELFRASQGTGQYEVAWVGNPDPTG